MIAKSGKSGQTGKSGKTGKTGKNGKNSKNGKNGKNGKIGMTHKTRMIAKSGKTGKTGKIANISKSGKKCESCEIIVLSVYGMLLFFLANQIQYLFQFPKKISLFVLNSVCNIIEYMQLFNCIVENIIIDKNQRRKISVFFYFFTKDQ